MARLQCSASGAAGMAVTFDEFSERIANCGIVPAGDVDAIRVQLSANRRNVDAWSVGNELVSRGRLTSYQLEELLAGRGDGLIMGNYLVLEKLGQGGMGLVLKAQHRRMKRLVALKLLLPEVSKSSELV